MSQVVYSGSINDELSRTTTARIHQATKEISSLYDAKIAAAQKDIAAVQAKEAKLQRQVTNSRFLSECEAGEVTCSQTAQAGLWSALQARRPPGGRRRCCAEERPAAVAATIATDRRKIALWQAAETAQIANRIRVDRGRPRLPRTPGSARKGREDEPSRHTSTSSSSWRS